MPSSAKDSPVARVTMCYLMSVMGRDGGGRVGTTTLQLTTYAWKALRAALAMRTKGSKILHEKTTGENLCGATIYNLSFYKLGL